MLTPNSLEKVHKIHMVIYMQFSFFKHLDDKILMYSQIHVIKRRWFNDMIIVITLHKRQQLLQFFVIDGERGGLMMREESRVVNDIGNSGKES